MFISSFSVCTKLYHTLDCTRNNKDSLCAVFQAFSVCAKQYYAIKILYTRQQIFAICFVSAYRLPLSAPNNTVIKILNTKQ